MSVSPVEFSSLVYGSFVNSLLEMSENVSEVNEKLNEIGYKIGLRLAHDFARDSTLERIDNPDKVINQVLIKKWSIISGSKTPLNVNVIKPGVEYILIFSQSIFTQNVQIPEIYQDVQYTGILPGALKGIFEIFHLKVKTTLLQESITKSTTEIKIEIIESIPEAIPKSDD